MSATARACTGCGIALEGERASSRLYCHRCTPTTGRIEPTVIDRTTSSPAVLANRVHELALAWRERDEDAARAELKALADEARLLSRQSPLWPSQLVQRQRIAAESDGLGRIG
jgi:hypothetical protein